jgi:hypothetical protein
VTRDPWAAANESGRDGPTNTVGPNSFFVGRRLVDAGMAGELVARDQSIISCMFLLFGLLKNDDEDDELAVEAPATSPS